MQLTANQRGDRENGERSEIVATGKGAEAAGAARPARLFLGSRVFTHEVRGRLGKRLLDWLVWSFTSFGKSMMQFATWCCL